VRKAEKTIIRAIVKIMMKPVSFPTYFRQLGSSAATICAAISAAI
jgi:hypothetical protein